MKYNLEVYVRKNMMTIPNGEDVNEIIGTAVIKNISIYNFRFEVEGNKYVYIPVQIEGQGNRFIKQKVLGKVLACYYNVVYVDLVNFNDIVAGGKIYG